MAVPKQSAPSRSEQNADCAEQFSVARPGNDCSPNGKNNLEVTGRPTEGVCLVGLMVKHLTIFFFGLRADWAFASWPSFSFFYLGSLTNGEGFGGYDAERGQWRSWMALTMHAGTSLHQPVLSVSRRTKALSVAAGWDGCITSVGTGAAGKWWSST